MSILVNADSRILVQGLTGREGQFHARQMLDYGTNIVAGCTPGKGGMEVLGVPVFNTCAEAVKATGADVSIIFVPSAAAADSACAAAAAGIKLVVLITEHIPVLDMVRAKAFLNAHGTRLIGPNCPGIITPGACKLGIMPGYIFKPGPIGLVSRSGTLTYEATYQLTCQGLGQSTCVGIGGDPVPGLYFTEILELFRDDDAVFMHVEVRDRRDRRGRGRTRRRLHQGEPVSKARLWLHRRADGPQGQTHGPRRRHYQRLQGARRGQDQGAGIRRGHHHP